MSQRAPEPGSSDQTSYPADVAKLTDWDQKLSVIADEAIDLQHELSRLREKSDGVVQLLEQREHELEEKTASLVQLAQEREQTETSTAAANASLSEAQALLQADRERMASLEQLLEQREHELDEKTASLVQLAQEREQTETSTAAANASLSEAQALLQADRERMASLEQLLEQREHELDEKTASLVQLAQEREQTETSTAAANASLSEAQALLQADRERMASLEQLLEQREHELDEKTASLVQLAQEREQTETSTAAANASLSEAQALLQADRERMASLEQLLELRRGCELERTERARAGAPLAESARRRARGARNSTRRYASPAPQPPPSRRAANRLCTLRDSRAATASRRAGRDRRQAIRRREQRTIPAAGRRASLCPLAGRAKWDGPSSLARGFRACSRPSRVALALRSHIDCDARDGAASARRSTWLPRVPISTRGMAKRNGMPNGDSPMTLAERLGTYSERGSSSARGADDA